MCCVWFNGSNFFLNPFRMEPWKAFIGWSLISKRNPSLPSVALQVSPWYSMLLPLILAGNGKVCLLLFTILLVCIAGVNIFYTVNQTKFGTSDKYLTFIYIIILKVTCTKISSWLMVYIVKNFTPTDSAHQLNYYLIYVFVYYCKNSEETYALQFYNYSLND